MVFAAGSWPSRLQKDMLYSVVQVVVVVVFKSIIQVCGHLSASYRLMSPQDTVRK